MRSPPSPGATLADAISCYHEGLTEELALESAAWLGDQLARRGLYFGDRPLCNVLRPRFLTTSQYAFLRRQALVLLRAFGAAQRAALEDRAVRAQFALDDWEESLLADDPGFEALSPVSRLDAFFTPADNGLRFTEYNAETPAGSAYGDVLAELFLALPGMQPFLRHFDLRPLPAIHSVLHALLGAYYQWAGRRETPTIGILDWAEVPTRSEFLLYAEAFQALGVPCIIADPREVEYRGGRLLAGGTPITLIYKRVLIHELIQRGGMEQPLVRAVRDRAVCMVNPFRCKILHKKASLAVLSDERNAGLFSADERKAIAAHIPWTRRVEERSTEHAGRVVDLLPYIATQRERLVLKPNDDYGGQGIVLGWETDSATWEGAVRTALERPYIVQERIPLPAEPFPCVANGRLRLEERIVDTAPFVFNGSYVDGCLTRVSTATLVNVTAGGGSTVPTFVVERR